MENKCSVILFLLLTMQAFAAQEVFLTPPTITSATIAQEVVCFRPMREGKFNISTEVFKGNSGTKIIVNCYGHGGSGWTTLFGSVNKAINLFEQGFLNKEKPIRVIGSGCMGLTCAVQLARQGYRVAGITTKDRYDIPSWRAAGYFALVSVRTSPEEQANLNEIGITTFKTYQQIEQGKHPYITQQAVRFMPVYCSQETEAGVEELEAQGLIPKKEFVTLNFGNGVTHPGYVKYMTYFMDTTSLMRQLWAEVDALGIPVEDKAITSFDEIEEEIIFNCSGLGARELNQDNTMISVRGHLIMLNEESGTAHMDYMIYTKVEQDGNDEYIYMFPKSISVTPDTKQGTHCRGTLGGTFIAHTDRLTRAQQDELDSKEFNKLLDRNCKFFHGRTYTSE